MRGQRKQAQDLEILLSGNLSAWTWVTLTKDQDKQKILSPLRENIMIERDWASGQACTQRWASEVGSGSGS